jgi:hypothetical protein
MVWAVSLLTTELISRSLTPKQHLNGIQSLIGFGNVDNAPSPVSALPPLDSFEASPKAISGRTSYLQVRLEFLRHPQLILDIFNCHRFGPPSPVKGTSTCPWVDHLVSGL